MKSLRPFLPCLLLLLSIPACTGGETSGSPETSTGLDDPSRMAGTLESSLFRHILDVWYPRNIDSSFGGYISVFGPGWEPADPPAQKSLVQQARHLWTTSFIAGHYPERTEYLDYAGHGFGFLTGSMWDEEYGGFFAHTSADGTPSSGRNTRKLVYGQAFAVYGLSRYAAESGNRDALGWARKAFLWMEKHAHDKTHGGYYEFLERNGAPVAEPGANDPGEHAPGTGLKDYNSSIHLLEAFTALHEVWPDSLVRERLREMFILVRDTFVHPDGYLQLYFYPDWSRVPDEVMKEKSGGNDYHTQHITYGHDVETAFLLLEAAGELGMEEDEKTRTVAKRLVDHSLASGWDGEKGGFFDAGHLSGGKITITNRNKSWWNQVEGLNALLMMHLLHPGDTHNYGGKFLQLWNYIDTYLIDKDRGGWYSAGIDFNPGARELPKSHGWKTTYHNVRGMVHCIEMLRTLAGKESPGHVRAKRSPEARELLAFLQGIRGEHILSGQHNYPHRVSVFSDSVRAITGKDPVVWGSDFSFHERAIPERQRMIDEAVRMHGKGHIITLMYHQVRPMDDEPGGWKESVQAEVTDRQWEEMLTPGTEIHSRWQAKTDTVAGYLKQLKDKGIPVLWRPYHEMNGIWFWWGNKSGFERLWVQTYERLAIHHGLNNLLWVWNANAPRQKENDDAFAYESFLPDLKYVDILAADVYHNDYKQSHHDRLLELANGKPIALGECGQAPTPEILEKQDQWTWFMIWARWLWTHNSREEIIRLYKDPRVITLDEIPELRSRILNHP